LNQPPRNKVFLESKIFKFALTHSLGLMVGNLLILILGFFFVRVMLHDGWIKRFGVQSENLTNGFSSEMHDREMVLKLWSSQQFAQEGGANGSIPDLDVASSLFNEGPVKYEFEPNKVLPEQPEVFDLRPEASNAVKYAFLPGTDRKEVRFTLCHRVSEKNRTVCSSAKAHINMQRYTVENPMMRTFRFDLLDADANTVAEYFPFNRPFQGDAAYTKDLLNKIPEQVSVVAYDGQEYFAKKKFLPKMGLYLVVMAPVALFKAETSTKDDLYFYVLVFISLTSFLINFEFFRRKILLPTWEVRNFEEIISRELGDATPEGAEAKDLHLIRYFFEKLHQDVRAFKVKESNYREVLQAEVRKLEEEKKHTVAQVIQMEKLSVMSRLMAGVAHEIRNPLTSIKLAIDNLKLKRDELTPNQSNYMDILSEEVLRLSRILDRFLGLGKKGVGVSYAKADLNEIVNQVVLISHDEIKSKRIDLELSLDHTIPKLNLIEDEMTSAIMNLLKNAVEAAPEHGKIKVKTLRSEGSVVLTVEDSGKGIDAGTEEKVFDIFFTTKANGSGLGLSQVMQTVSVHHGEIAVERSDLGGALFRMALPVEG